VDDDAIEWAVRALRLVDHFLKNWSILVEG
jgi:hypothetical protein